MRYKNDDLGDTDLFLSLKLNSKFDYIFHEATISDTTALEQDFMTEREDITQASKKAMNLKESGIKTYMNEVKKVYEKEFKK